MPEWWANLTRTIPFPAVLIAGGVAILAAGFALSRGFRRRISAGELEKRRRQFVHRNGKPGDAEIIDIDGSTIFYSYSVSGVGYTTSQDVGSFGISLPADRMAVIGPVSIRFLPANPANSIVACEEWSGLRNRDHNHESSPARST